LRERAGAREFFAGKPEHNRRAKIECGHTVDEQWIVSVGGLPNNWPQNSMQFLNNAECVHGSTRHALRDRLSSARGAFVREDVAKKGLESPRGASTASDQITERAQRQVTEHVLTNSFRRQIQCLADVQERKWPGTIIGHDPAISIEIEFPLDFARSAMEPSHIQRSLLEDSGRQIFPARLELIVVGSVHAILIWFVISFLKRPKIAISENLRFLCESFRADALRDRSLLLKRSVRLSSKKPH
jgi:hypothetical protein